MVLAAGLTSRREPASFSRRLVELAIDEAFDLVVTETLLDEVQRVLVNPRFVGRMSEEEAAAAIVGLVAVASIVVSDAHFSPGHLTDDPDDDYLARVALQVDAYLVTRDDAAGFERVAGLRVGRPGTALRLIGALDE
jgi:predicted nucleic acid-binding protein